MTQQSTPQKSQLSRLLGISHLLAAVAAVGVASAIVLVYQFISLRQTLTADVTVQAAIIADNISASLMFRDREAAADMLRSFHPAPFLEEAAVHDLGGKEFASYRRAPAAAPGSGPRWLLFEPVAVTRPVVYRGSLLGHVRLVADTAGIREAMWRFGLLLGLAFAGALTTSAMVSRKIRARMARAERELAVLAYTDTVTSLPNRRASQEALASRIAHARRGQSHVGLLMIDLDNFKLVNDTAGHAAGDQLLRQVAAIVRAQVRDSDMVARLGGDEFVVIAGPLRNPAELHRVAQRIIDALQRPLLLDGVEFVATASIGSAFFPDDAQNAEELIRNADTALYKAKDAGRNRLVQFRREMVMAAQRRAQLERDLRAALEHRRLEVFYQPQSDAATGRLHGVEALARWKHHEHGYIPPSEFIPVAEECGLIGELGKWVLERACSDMVALEQRTGRALYVAVNVSACQFRNNGFLHEVRDVLARTGLPAGRLELELTESVLMEDLARAVEFMHAVRAYGVHIAVDDFGTGYSSLSYLQSFPIDRLKLDRSFVTPLPGAGGTLAGAVITLAHGFGLTVVAEGVETEGQLDWLRDAGCDTIQGFLLGRPMPFEALLAVAGHTQDERATAVAVE